jgi:nitrogen-specific signal transduction histidine kinase
MAELVQFSVPKSVRLALNLEQRLPVIRMDPSQFEQIIMNLLINAGEARLSGVGKCQSWLPKLILRSERTESRVPQTPPRSVPPTSSR